MKLYGHSREAADKVGLHPLWLAYQFHKTEALHDLLPQDAQLHLCQAIAHAAVYTETERAVVTGVANKLLGPAGPYPTPLELQ